ncbi:MAG TPA: efflux RND transporter periplasmic adaptor subunit [Rhizomicrobium sp.]|jgi:multidrug efflux system membrane fusion protein|nr:efflux RND transporter periplasmic adaptor subunit [Rhizomicrobium sp.]
MLRNVIANLRRFWERAQPGFWRRMKPSYRAAAAITVLVSLWLGSGILSGGAAKHADDSQTKTNELASVQVQRLTAVPRDASITVRGRTQALHSVDVKAEIDGVVQALHFEKGDFVKAGQLLCELKTNDRAAKLDQAKAQVAETEQKYKANIALANQGYLAKTLLAESATALEAARAAERTGEMDLARTQIRAPFNGLVDDRYVNVGDLMHDGDKCAMLIAPEPFLAVGSVSENDVGSIRLGDTATATLVTGETVQGRVRFVADHADAGTRTFRIEVELPNPNAKLRDGVSADIRIPVKNVRAAKISPGILVLNDNGVVGVRIVQNGIVRFRQVQIISDGPDGMWVTGVPDGTTVITVGQEFVSEGARVKPVVTGARA